MLSVLTKPPNLAFVLLVPLRNCSRRVLALTMLPAIALALLWSWRSGADTATWRMVEITGHDAVTFDPVARLQYLFEHPLHFPAAVIHAVGEKDLGELWRQVIGVLGLFDTVLQWWVYPTISALLFASFLTRLPVAQSARLSIAIVAAVTTLAYTVAIYLVCYLTFTPLEANSVWGVQGRYFVPILPLAATIIASVVDRSLDERLYAALAISVAVLSGGASLEAILHSEWNT